MARKLLTRNNVVAEEIRALDLAVRALQAWDQPAPRETSTGDSRFPNARPSRLACRSSHTAHLPGADGCSWRTSFCDESRQGCIGLDKDDQDLSPQALDVMFDFRVEVRAPREKFLVPLDADALGKADCAAVLVRTSPGTVCAVTVLWLPSALNSRVS